MIEKFTKDIYKNLVLDGVNAYQGMYDEMTADMDHDLFSGNLRRGTG